VLLRLQRTDRTGEGGHERQREQRRRQADGGPVGLKERVEGELRRCDDAESRDRADDLEGRRGDRAQPVGAKDLPSGGRDQPRRARRGSSDLGQTHQPIVAVPEK